MNFHLLNQKLPPELSRKVLEFTGTTYEREKKSVIEQLEEWWCEKNTKRWYDFMDTTDFYNRDSVTGLVEYDDIIYWTSESSILTTMEFLMYNESDSRFNDWEHAKEILTRCDRIGASLIDACNLIHFYVFNEPNNYPELVEIYERAMIME